MTDVPEDYSNGYDDGCDYMESYYQPKIQGAYLEIQRLANEVFNLRRQVRELDDMKAQAYRKLQDNGIE